MSMHNTPLTDLEREGLEKHLLAIEYPSHLADVFRQGMAWALSKSQPASQDADWLWLQLMDYCKHKEKAPAQDSDLFSIVTRLRKLLTFARGIFKEDPNNEKGVILYNAEGEDIRTWLEEVDKML